MIPYFEFPTYHLGPFTIEIFGVFAALGIYLGARLSAGRAARMGLDPQPLVDWAMWGVIGGILGGHFAHLFLYHPEELQDPKRIFMVWDGLSSFGGLLGGLATAIVYFRRKKISLLSYGDAFALGIAPGWGVARIGCFLVHDHPGIRSSLPFAVAYPGGARFDLGLIDALALFAIAVLLYALARRGSLKGALLPLLAVLYNVQRFLTDFLRASDVSYHDARYLGLTPAQYIAIGLTAWGAWMLARHFAASGAASNASAPGDKPAERMAS